MYEQIFSRARARITGVLCFLLSQVSQQGTELSVAAWGRWKKVVGVVLLEMSLVLLETSRRFGENKPLFWICERMKCDYLLKCRHK